MTRTRGDLVENDTPANCLKNIWYKLNGNRCDLSADNLSRLSASEITGARREDRDLMQWALIVNNRANVQLLSRYFNLRDYTDYLGTLSFDVQRNMADIFGLPIPTFTPTFGR